MSEKREAVATIIRDIRSAPRDPPTPVTDNDRMYADRILALVEGGEPEISLTPEGRKVADAMIEAHEVRMLRRALELASADAARLRALVEDGEPVGVLVYPTDAQMADYRERRQRLMPHDPGMVVTSFIVLRELPVGRARERE